MNIYRSRVGVGFHLPLILAVGLVGGCGLQATSIPAFPGAEGFGSATPGGRNGRVLLVTNLDNSGPGSLRAACETEGPRIVVFRTGGTITLTKTIEVKNPFITIAGQTAPGGGIALRNDPAHDSAPLRIITHDVVVRHLRVRPGPSRERSPCVDGIAIETGASNIVVDHCSVSWGTDETFQLWGAPHDVTLQWSFVAEALHRSTHPHGAHSKGLLLSSRGCKNVTVHHCLLAHNDERNPRIGMSGPVDFVNNVIYNPDCIGQVTDGFARQEVNYVGNYVKLGPNSQTEPPVEASSRHELFAWEKGGHGFSFYVKGNIGPHRPGDDMDERLVVDPRDWQYITATRHDTPPVTTQSAAKALELVLTKAGASLPRRDPVDERVVKEVRTGTGRIIDDPSQVGGWPELARGVPPVDRDQDGMPDEWEKQHRLDPANASDNKADPDGDGYTNIEEYLNATDPRVKEKGTSL